jgi:GNAT superfamily N-acetyltransferase
MSDKVLVFRPLDFRTASDLEYECLSEFKNLLRREYLPDDPPIPLEENIQDWKNIPQFVEYEAYAMWNETKTQMIAECDVAIYNTGDNEHMADFSIEVRPEHRRKGIGRDALRLVLPFVKKHGRRLLLAFTNDRIPASALFMERLGARKGQESHTNQLKVSEFDRKLIDDWLEKSSELKDGFQLGFWEGAYPEDRINEISDLYQEVANDQPRDDLEMEDMKFIPQFFRDIEKNMLARGEQRWTLYLVDATSGNLAGLTEVMWNPNRKMILDQGFTGVYPAYRSKGLGRWLKAEMMQKILTERSEVEFIRTRNANSNAPMLKINVEMGFKPYIANTVWQIETEKVENYLLEVKQ